MVNQNANPQLSLGDPNNLSALALVVGGFKASLNKKVPCRTPSRMGGDYTQEVLQCGNTLRRHDVLCKCSGAFQSLCEWILDNQFSSSGSATVIIKEELVIFMSIVRQKASN